jgi:predicted ester cyclase
LIAAECPLYMGSNLMGTGPEGYRRTLAMLRSGFPDLHSTIEEVIAEGDKIAERVTTSDTHRAR